MRRALLWVVLSALGAPAATDGAPILVNGSFELGPANGSSLEDVDVAAGSSLLTGWEVFAVSASAGAVDHLNTPWDVSDGIHGIDLDGRDALFSGVRQAFATIAGRRYDVAFDLSGNTGGGPVVKQVRVTVDGFSLDYAHDSSGQTKDDLIWDLIAFSFVASGPTSTLSFMSLTGVPNSYGALIDNVRVVPEPGALLLIGVGLAISRARRRRSKSAYEPEQHITKQEDRPATFD